MIQEAAELLFHWEQLLIIITGPAIKILVSTKAIGSTGK
jgi:hypothetical protein